MIVKRSNPFTGEHSMDLDVTKEQLKEWQDGGLIQNVMPQLSPEERDFLITGIPPNEQDY